MESEFISKDSSDTCPIKNIIIASDCEEVLLPTESITNGDGDTVDVEVGTIEFLEENDPMEDMSPEKEMSQTSQDEHDLEEEYDDELDEEVEEEENLDDEEDQMPIERIPTQVPKKRKDAAMLAAAAEDEIIADMKLEVDEHDEHDENDERDERDEHDEHDEELPTSSARALANRENTVDEEQCRVCTVKDDLVSLFKKVEQLTVAEMLMVVCPTVSIARKDFMPQYICNSCLDNVTIAVQLKAQCETTERELRKKLSRSKNKLRRPTGYVVIDAPVESDPPSDPEEELNDDVEFKVSDEASISADDDSDDSDFSTKKKRPTRGGGGRRGRRKSSIATPTPKSAGRKRMGRPPLKRAPVEEYSSDDDGDSQPYSKKKRYLSASDKDSQDRPNDFPCDECEQVFSRKLSLVLHKKAHSGGRAPINCEVCGKQFKIQGAYRTHLEKHKDDTSGGYNCGKCDQVFGTKADLRAHLTEDHNLASVVHQCNKCRRTFVSEARLARHKDGRCPSADTKPKKHDYESFTVGKDLFKSVAPLTTTYWSDSFSD